MSYYKKIILILLCSICIACGSETEQSIILNKGITFDEVNETIFLLDNINVKYELEDNDSVYTIRVSKVDLARSNYVFSKYKEEKKKIHKHESEKYTELSNLLSTINGVYITKVVELEDDILVNVITTPLVEKVKLEKEVKKLLGDKTKKSFRVILSEYNPVKSIIKYNYEYILSNKKKDEK
ncbi:hypothetical protein [Aliivibrio fischeri]|uniref:hypothetical protein n=1 Tax=Aliivibrio fischeri TaxID=668 RepID=UPI0006D10B09|nr:hypothetical protein [Aliivibrio fischeri]USR97952.1 hypothetical protein AVFI_15920 [Aliivibrio fischeri ATCC 7744 = JCM 18803 = DSM 507]GGK20278.1 hypothetical protein GCM10007987_00240 [Aliivibrio fischeri]